MAPPPTTLLLHPRGATVAMGVFGIADALDRARLPVKIVHYQMERRLNRRFDLGALIRLHGVRLVGVSVHWMHQSYEALKLTEAIKLRFPEVMVCWGGFTASAFAREIVRDFRVVDTVIQGDGERPFLALAQAVAAGKAGAEALRDVPNAVWRDGAEAVQNPLGYVADGEILSGMSFARFDLMSSSELYLQTHSIVNGTFPAPTYFLNVGRGCPVNCPWCGGAREAFKANTGRKKIAYRSADSVIADWRKAVNAGCRSVYVCFEPIPNGPYYFELFEKLRAEGLNTVALAFGAWAMPSPELIEAMAKTFPRVLVELSPETSSEERRKIVRGWPYSNEVLEDRIGRCVAAGFDTDVYFSYPHPGETAQDILATSAYAAELGRRFPAANVAMLALSTDPNSPLFQRPSDFGMRIHARSFADYAALLARLERDQRPWLENELFHCPVQMEDGELLRVGFGVHLATALRRRARPVYEAVSDLLGGPAEADRWLDAQVAEPLWRELERRRRDEGQLVLDQATLYSMYLERLAAAPPSAAARPAASEVVRDVIRLHHAHLRISLRGKPPDLHGRGSAVEHSYSPPAPTAAGPGASLWRPVVNPSAERLELRFPVAPGAPRDLAALERDPPGQHAALVFKDFADRTQMVGLDPAQDRLVRACDGVATLSDLVARLGPETAAAAASLAKLEALL